MINSHHKVDNEFYYYFRKIYAYPVPINADIEKRKVMKDRSYNPQLKYEKHPNSIAQIESKIKNIKIPAGIFSDILKKKKEELLYRCDLVANVGKSGFTDASIKLYGKPSKELVKKAYKLMDLDVTKEDNGVKLNTVSSVKKILDSLLTHGFKWQVQARDMVVGARFNLSRKVLYINKNRKFSDNDIKRLIVHEIGTHIARAENGKKQKYVLFSYGFPNYMETEEGLAVYNEKENDLLSNSTLKQYAGRVIAVNLALNNSFSIIYNELLQYFNKDVAWNLALRAKRGLFDTSKKGGFIKDHIYLRGKYLVEDFVKKGGNIKDLYIGKIGVEHVPLIDQLI